MLLLLGLVIVLCYDDDDDNCFKGCGNNNCPFPGFMFLIVSAGRCRHGIDDDAVRVRAVVVVAVDDDDDILHI